MQVPDQKARMRAQRNIIPANRAHPSALRYSLIVCILKFISLKKGERFKVCCLI